MTDVRETIPRRSASAMIFTLEFYVAFIWGVYLIFADTQTSTTIATVPIVIFVFVSLGPSIQIRQECIRTRRSFVPIRVSIGWSELRRFERTGPGELSWYPRGYRGVFAVLEGGRRIPIQESTSFSNDAVDRWIERLEDIRLRSQVSKLNDD